ncbi:MAG: outer membrane beta-barrel protein [Acidobacteriota bacterium]
MQSHAVRAIVVIGVLLGTVALAGAASAQGLYIGGAYSWATTDIEDVNADLIDDNANGYKAFLGYEFPAVLGIEAGYVEFGDYDIGEFEGFEGSRGQFNSNGWTAALTGRVPIGKLVTVYGKVGYFFWDSELDIEGDLGDVIGELSEDGQDPFYGAGLRLNFGKISVLGEYERYDSSEDFNHDLFSLGVRFTF